MPATGVDASKPSAGPADPATASGALNESTPSHTIDGGDDEGPQASDFRIWIVLVGLAAVGLGVGVGLLIVS